MRKIIFALEVVMILIICASSSYAGLFDNFFHPRPQVVQKDMLGLEVTSTSVTVLEFKPTFLVSTVTFRQNQSEGMDVGFLSGAGPAITLQNETQDANGMNYALYSASLGLLITGDSRADPTFVPSLVLQIAFLNNLVGVGVGYDLVKRVNTEQELFFIINFGINLTNN